LSNDPDLPFGQNTLKLRAALVPDGAAVSMADITAMVGPDPVMIPAVLVPDGASLPGYPYEHIGQAMFIPDQDNRVGSTRTNPQQLRRTEPPTDTQHNTPSGLQQFGTLAGPPRSWAPGTAPVGADSASGVLAPRRGVRNAQANFGSAAPQPHLDTSRDAIDAAVRALRVTRGSGLGLDLSLAMLDMSQPGLRSDWQLPNTDARTTQIAAGHDRSAGAQGKQQYTVGVELLPDKPTSLINGPARAAASTLARSAS
jgi:hypothetical protein